MWWQAHALDALLDAYERRPDDVLAARLDAHLRGILRRSHGTGSNDYYDDMAWLALALQRMANLRVGSSLLLTPLVGRLLTQIQGGSSDRCGGGVAWARQHPDFKNVPATAPAAILALRTPDQAGRHDWALGLIGWMHATLVLDGVVWDGTHARSDGTCELERAEYTYCYGVVIGADLAAYQVTGDPAFLARARRTADSASARMGERATGLWRDEGPGDGGLFKGILSRHLGDLALVTSDPGFAQTLERQGTAAWKARSLLGMVGGDWSRRAPDSVDLSEHLSAVMVIEQCAKLQRRGLLASDG
jgi:predicted alpha-1,6-mannanase (GH76 family)